MLIQCQQCQKEYLSEDGVRAPSGKAYCSHYCLKQALSPEENVPQASTPARQGFPLGQMLLVIGVVCGSLYLLQSAFSSPDNATTVSETQDSQMQQETALQAVANQPPFQNAKEPNAASTAEPSVTPTATAPPDNSESEVYPSGAKLSPEMQLQAAEKNMKVDPVAARASLEQLTQSAPSSKAFTLLAHLQAQANEFSAARRSAEQCLNQSRTVEERKSCHELSIEIYQKQVAAGIDEDASATQRSQTAAQLSKQSANPSASALPSLAPQLTDRVKEELKQEQLRHAQELITLDPKDGKGYWHKAEAQCRADASPDLIAQANANIAEACHLNYAAACQQRCRNGAMGAS